MDVIPSARRLADWWDQHQADDLHHEQEDQEKRDTEMFRQQALAKLTMREKMALGIKP